MNRLWCTFGRRFVGECSVCGDCKDNQDDSTFVDVPHYETVAQWEARTGREYPDSAPVWFSIELSAVSNYPDIPNWGLWKLLTHRKASWEAAVNYASCKTVMLAATEAGAPPDGWRPE